ncbi:hypothetical protein [Peribacillus loiseleuriae]|uniref:Uncharacterized protein n=1 Tax=Peribacillus loiseleuriae TaxID=1679170 RepID=A0A0K9GZW4_9BACI|nr:hypothetical protein [Peribacillus loiseleuriae]KMY51812.1 hypothetical protein AC625_21665 [Peribacillus loiseleuriae]
MEQSKQSLIKILLIINLAINTCAAIGVGYVVYKQSMRTDFSGRGDGQGFPGNGHFQQRQTQSEQTQ